MMQAKDIDTDDLLRYIYEAGQGERREVPMWELLLHFSDVPPRVLQRKVEKMQRQGLLSTDPKSVARAYWLTSQAATRLSVPLVF